MGFFEDLKDGYVVGAHERQEMDENGFDPACSEDVLTWRKLQQGFVDGWTTCDECCEEITEEEFEDNNNHCGRCWSHKQEGEGQ